MKTYRLLVHDDQFAAPVELVVEMAHDARVAEFCRDRMQKSASVSSIEVWSGGKKLCQIWSEARQAA